MEGVNIGFGGIFAAKQCKNRDKTGCLAKVQKNMAKKIFDNSDPPNLQGFRNLEGFVNNRGFAPLYRGMFQRDFCSAAKQKS